MTGLVAIVILHNLSSPFQRHAGPFIQLSYFNSAEGTFGRGVDDAYFVAMSVLLFTAVRAICVDYIFRPFATARGLKPKASIRFAEQGWQFVYYFTYWTFGMVCLRLLHCNQGFRITLLTWKLYSISGRHPTIGSILLRSGPTGQFARHLLPSRSILFRRWPSGSSRSWF